MTYIEITFLALALSVDAFSVGASVGMRHRSTGQIFRLSFCFGLFHLLMPLAGVFAGTLLLTLIKDYDHWIAFVILTVIGIRMITSAFKADQNRVEFSDPTKGFSLWGLSLAVSIDTLAAGISLPAAGAPIFISVLIISIAAALATAVAMLLAGRIMRLIGKRSEVFAGLILIGLGFKILNEHIKLFDLALYI